MNKKELLTILRPKGNYTKTDMSNYSGLTGGLIRAALISKTPDRLMPLFSLIEDKDSSVGSEIEKRVSSTENRFYIHNAGERYNDSVDEIILTSLDARLYGIGICELYLDDNGDFAYRRIDKEFFYYEDGKVLLSVKGKKIEPTEPKFIVFRHKPVLTKLLWIVYAKHFVLSHFLKFTEFLGVPPLVANVSSSDTDTMNDVTDAIKNIKSAAYAVLGKDDALKVLEGRGSQDDFLKFVGYADAEIAKSINGQVLTSNVGSSGSLAQAQVHEAGRLEISAKDAKYATRCVAKAFSVIGIEPALTIFIEKDKDLYQRAQTLEILYRMGYDMSVEDVNKEFDLKLFKRATVTNSRTPKSIKFIKEPNAKKSKVQLDRIDSAIEKELNMPITLAEEEMLTQFEEIIDSSGSYEEAFDALIKAYPHIKTDVLEGILETALINSFILGDFEGGDGQDDI